ncbi:glycogen synthase [uncultured Agrococcus sp.]|uniref:glycogen synthase n=1 Tax=uncultured Agrococcus sp. TaxID=382258 RepID=UPI0025F04281|nr:glycogen synthase [uncultured Agrococcus sp.]
MKVDIVTKEYPPAIYGGAGVHVTELVRALRDFINVRVHAFGEPRDERDVLSYPVPPEYSAANPALQTLAVDLLIAESVSGADLVHSHTWYANEAGRRASQLHGIGHVITAHSLEPLRPWKAEQLGGGYRVSSDIERLAYEQADRVIAVSEGMRRDILRVYPDLDPARVVTIHNGIDLSDWARVDDPDRARALGLNPDHPSVIFVGRITRQKGLPYLLKAAAELPQNVQLILCAGAPDTDEIMQEVRDLVDALRARRDGVVWIEDMLPRRDLCTLLSHATVFVCPSVYEPLGIVNLEAMACGAAVVGSGTGGIPEVVAHGETGLIVPIEQLDDGTGTPTDPARFITDLADALAELTGDPDRAHRMGAAGRVRAEQAFTWERIAVQTRAVYQSVIDETHG